MRKSTNEAGRWLRSDMASVRIGWKVAIATAATALVLAALGWGSGSVPAFALAVPLAGAALVSGGFAVIYSAILKWFPASGKFDAFNHLVEHVRDAVLRFDADGELAFSSKSSQKLFGCPRYELSGPGLAERTHVLDRPLYLTALADVREGGKDRTIEIRMRRDNPLPGQVAPDYVWMEIDLSPLRKADREISPFETLALIRDISRRKENERRMIEAQKTSEKSSLAKSQFLAVIGHELRTPLNAIVGFSDMMAAGIGGSLNATHTEYAQLISRGGHHLLEVVNMLLDMAKIEAGKFELQTERFQPESLVAPCLQIVSKAAREKNVEIEVKLGRNLPEVLGDERACRQILINLLSNAVKFSDPGKRIIWSIKRQGQFLSLSVSDSGIGMSQDVIDRLGEPFFQAQSSADRQYEGTGLGISIVKGLVELHQGTLKVTSTPGQGTTFAVLLPINGPETRIGDSEQVTRLETKVEKTKVEPGEWQEARKVAR